MSLRRLDVSRMAETERKSGKEGFLLPYISHNVHYTKLMR